MKKKIAFVIVAILIVIQFFHPKKNQSTELLASDITKVTTVPDSVMAILKVACMDCHSNNKRYPWYNNIEPVAWWLSNHINEGKQKLNFSTFGKLDATKAAKKLKGIAKVIEKDKMPLSSYTIIHRDAILNDAQKQIVMNWAKNAVISKPVN